MLMQEDGVSVSLEIGGLVVSPDHPYFAASVDHFQTIPDRCILELKSWSHLPEELPQDAYLQVVMQLGIAQAAGMFNSQQPKAVVFAMSPSLQQQRSYIVTWDRRTQRQWHHYMVPKLHMFYAHRLLPKLVSMHSSLIATATPAAAATPGATAFPMLVQPAAEHDQPSSPATEPSPPPIHDELVEQTPTLKPGKVVSHRKSGRTGVLREVLQCGKLGKVDWSGGRQRDTPVNLAGLEAPCVPPEHRLSVTSIGQRVRVCGGNHLGKEGVLETLNRLDGTTSQPI